MKRIFLITAALIAIIVFAWCWRKQPAQTSPNVPANNTIENKTNLENSNQKNNSEAKKSDEQVITDYLNNETNDILEERKGKLFSAFAVLGQDKDNLYIWVFKAEYYKENGKLAEGSAVSLPVVLNKANGINGIEIKGHDFPKDGDYNENIKKLFPNNIIEIINKNQVNSSKLEGNALSQAEAYFGS